MELADGIEAVVREHIPRLEHGHDGLIFTCAETGYVVGTDEMCEWKGIAVHFIQTPMVLSLV